jgi:glycosyltransferase involved in cell wall biosynthesis
MRVVFDAPLVGDRRNGPATHVASLLPALIRSRPDLEFVARHYSRHGPSANRRSAATIDPAIQPVTTHLPTKLVRLLQDTVRMPNERWLVGDFNLYHQFHADCDPVVDSRRLIVTLHDTVALTWPAEEGQMYRHSRRLLRRAAAVITVSQYSRSEIVRQFEVDPDRVHVCHNGVDAKRFRPDIPECDRLAARHQFSLTRPYFIYAGGHTPRKNLQRLLQGYLHCEAASGVDLVLAGPAGESSSALADYSAVDPGRGRIRLIGHVDDALMPALYAEATALAYPSLYEGFGLPVLEAMAAGTVVVTSRMSALPEVAGDAALYVDALDPRSIGAGLDAAAGLSAAQRLAFRDRGLMRVQEFGWETAALEVAAVYDEVYARLGTMA